MIGRGWRTVGVLVVIATPLFTSGCGVSDDSPASSQASAAIAEVAGATTVGVTTAPSTAAPSTATPTALGNKSEWCDAIAQLAASQPSGSYSYDENEVAYLAYAEAAKAAAMAAPEDAEVLVQLAEASRITATDPGDPRQAKLYGDIAAELYELAARATQECDISFDESSN